ncbi:hypothetical protein K470DRAFT_271592 [Piedraia hortae CBS 480.64]|uniref:Uncharacterized protein n=1 Tax=Piedraia hortae CBS 480.64 TaxID=1314780 RepID=A0A6A7BW24_9PEZI|nr:hypothetical protein K470DRAFT_271592 [Piedraia hortae CBS 480.64]
MSSNTMETPKVGESQQYEGNLGLTDPHKKSEGQLGDNKERTKDSDGSTVRPSEATGRDMSGKKPEDKTA